jgi:protein-L-isoaspartate(D-aspartate) O-methyltransferase
MSKQDISDARETFARNVTADAGVHDARLREAFAALPREKFLGTGPWEIARTRRGGYACSESDDPRHVYVDALIALDPAHNVNNGKPSAHAAWIEALDLKPGERVVHIGAGTGYYTAILAELVGPSGHVEAFEIDPALASRARGCLADRANVALRERSGAAGVLPPADAIYVNAGATAPLDLWLDALAPGGRLLFPLTDEGGAGGMLLVTRSKSLGWAAHFVSGAAFIDMSGGRQSQAAKAVRAAFRSGGADAVRSLWRDERREAEDWLRGEGWRLSRVAAGE